MIAGHVLSAAEAYAARIDAVEEQRARVQGERNAGGRWDRLASNFRVDPRRALDENMEIVASYVRPDDVLVDVGGGAGRWALPLALRCREVINVEPSAGMRGEFEASATEAGITNARCVPADWLTAEGIEGDVTLVANVTYFVRDIARFIEKLVAASRRRVMITVGSPPQPAAQAALFKIAYGEDLVAVPGHRELLPVLWEMGILPDVRVLPHDVWRFQAASRTREEAVQSAVGRIDGLGSAEVAQRIDEQFDRLFARVGDEYRPLWMPRMRELLITWETRE